MAQVGKRPFWMHQLVEYILGAALVASGLQSLTPAAPAVVGGVIILHAAMTKGPLCAFRVIGRRLHRVIDIGVIAFELLVALQPWVSVDSSARTIIGAIAMVHAFVWWQSSFLERVKRQARAAAANPVEGDRSHEIGRTAGRLVGGGVKMAKRAKAKRDSR
jgi:hypothetical protein